MNILILGTGNMASGLAKQISKAGHRLHIVGRHPDKATALAARVGATAVAAGEAASKAEVIIVATGFPEALPALRALGDITGKVVVDITNPLTADFMGLTLGHSTSAAEEIAKALPGAQVVKAFNTVFAQVLEEGPDFGNGQVVPVFYAGDSERARETIRVLIESLGFRPVAAGGLKNARYLEPLAGLNIYFGYGAGQGTAIAPTWIARQ